MTVFISHSPAEPEEFAAELGARLKPGDVIAFKGGLGAGKTAFTRGLAKGMGFDHNEVSSPTFAILNIYKNGGTELRHFDMYRVATPEALYSTGFYDYLDDTGVLAIEWSENIAEELPENKITVAIEATDENTRRITVDNPGA
jgi:tRNA threonylcarbamoyladenosine biosynthesis protein TsaE